VAGVLRRPLKIGLPIGGLSGVMRQILPRLAPLLVLSVLAAAAPARAQDEPTDQATSQPADQKAPEHKVTQSKSYISLDPFYTTIVADNRVAGMLMISVGLDVPGEALHAEVDRAMPVLRDAYLRNLMAFTANSVRTDEQPDVAMIASRLQAVTDRALKHKGAKVLLSQVAIQLSK